MFGRSLEPSASPADGMRSAAANAQRRSQRSGELPTKIGKTQLPVILKADSFLVYRFS